MTNSSDKPNILFIIADQMRSDCLGVSSEDMVYTPNLDQLATEGCHFTKAYTQSPSCIPARASMMTGMDIWHAGVLGMGAGQGHMAEDFPHTLAGTLGNAGYNTQLVGKGHFNPQRNPMGFDATLLDESGRMGESSDYRLWFYDQVGNKDITPDDHGIGWNAWQARPWHTEEYLHPTAWTAKRSLEYINGQVNENKPFFLNMSFARPHSPYVPPRDYFDLYDGKTLPKAAMGDWVDEDSCQSRDTQAWRAKLTESSVNRGRAGYYGEISFIDAQIGYVLNMFRKDHPKAFANTWIIFVSDHGDMVGDHHLWRKTYAYEGSAHVPLIVKPPASWGIDHHVCDQVASLEDLMPSMLDMAGVPLPPTVTGKSLLPLMKDGDTPWRDYIHGEHSRCYAAEQEMQYLTDGKTKLIWLPALDTYQLFDLDIDPLECHDLLDNPRYAPIQDDWMKRLVNILEARDCGWVKEGKPYFPGTPMVSPYQAIRYQGPEVD